MSHAPTTALMQKAYARWAPFYDVVYDKLTEPAAREAVGAAMASGSKVLEVGVGTGLALGYYPPDAQLWACDLSLPMLQRARSKVQRKTFNHVKGLTVMDACRLGFPDGFFDAVAAQFVITLVPRPEEALAEFKRVLRPRGEIILVNHFGVEDGVVGALEDATAPLAAKVGWSTGFKASRVRRWADGAGMEFVSLQRVFPAGFFKVMRLRKASS